MDFIEWMHETHRMAEQPVKAAMAAAEQGNARACAPAAKEAALLYLRRFLDAVGDREAATGDSIACLLDAAAGHDRYFDRLQAEARRLDAAAESRASPEDIVDALKEIRFMAMARAGAASGFSVDSGGYDPRLKLLVQHATTVERAVSIFAHGRLYSFNQCVRRGLLSGEPIGAKYLLDPRRCADFVGVMAVTNYYASEKVANSQRKGFVDEELAEDYQPSVRLFFRKDVVQSLPGLEDDGLHQFLVRDQLSLDHLLCAVFPSEQAREEALERVQEPGRRERLVARCIVALPECCGDPRDYVRATNEMVVEWLGER